MLSFFHLIMSNGKFGLGLDYLWTGLECQLDSHCASVNSRD